MQYASYCEYVAELLTVKYHFSLWKSTALETYLHFTVVFSRKKIRN